MAIATFVAGGILSSLFAGPGAGSAAGPLLVFGHSSLAASAAAGLELSITALMAGVLYSVMGAGAVVGGLLVASRSSATRPLLAVATFLLVHDHVVRERSLKMAGNGIVVTGTLAAVIKAMSKSERADLRARVTGVIPF